MASVSVNTRYTNSTRGTSSKTNKQTFENVRQKRFSCCIFSVLCLPYSVQLQQFQDFWSALGYLLFCNFRNPPNSDRDWMIQDVPMWSFCMRIHKRGLGSLYRMSRLPRTIESAQNLTQERSWGGLKTYNLLQYITVTHSYSTVYPRSEVFSRSFPLRRGPAWAGGSKTVIDVGKLDRFTSNVCITPPIDHHGWNGKAFPCPVMWISWHLIGFLNTSQSTFSFWFRTFAGTMHFIQKRQENAIIWCVWVIVTMLS